MPESNEAATGNRPVHKGPRRFDNRQRICQRVRQRKILFRKTSEILQGRRRTVATTSTLDLLEVTKAADLAHTPIIGLQQERGKSRLQIPWRTGTR
jgi:hypothetical protein